jgi:hypothetical protein
MARKNSKSRFTTERISLVSPLQPGPIGEIWRKFANNWKLADRSGSVTIFWSPAGAQAGIGFSFDYGRISEGNGIEYAMTNYQLRGSASNASF